MPIPRAPILVKQLTRVRRYKTPGGDVIDVDGTDAFMGMWIDMLDSAADRGAQHLRKAMIDVYRDNGPGWKDDEPSTLEWKFPYRHIMRGKTGQMLDAAKNIEIRSSVTGTSRGGRAPSETITQIVPREFYASYGRDAVEVGPPTPFAKLEVGGRPMTKNTITRVQTSRFIGVFNETPHDPSDPNSPTIAGMFALHEFGSRDGHIPARPWISKAADLGGQRALELAVDDLVTSITATTQFIGTEARAKMEAEMLKNNKRGARGLAEIETVLGNASRTNGLGIPTDLKKQLAEIGNDPLAKAYFQSMTQQLGKPTLTPLRLKSDKGYKPAG